MSNADFLQARVESLEKLLRDLTKEANTNLIDILTETLVDEGIYFPNDMYVNLSKELTNKMKEINNQLKNK